MPQYGEANHVFELMQVTRAALSYRDARRWPGTLLEAVRLRAGDPTSGRVTSVSHEAALLGVSDTTCHRIPKEPLDRKMLLDPTQLALEGGKGGMPSRP